MWDNIAFKSFMKCIAIHKHFRNPFAAQKSKAVKVNSTISDKIH